MPVIGEKSLGRIEQEIFTQSEFAEMFSRVSPEVGDVFVLDAGETGQIKCSRLEKRSIGKEQSIEEFIGMLQHFDLYRGQYHVIIKDGGKVDFSRVQKRWV